MTSHAFQFNPKLDLQFERIVDVPRELVWKCWTQPEHLKVWFCPKPWSVSKCELDLRPGGLFSTMMVSPDGQEFPNVGCYLEVVPNQRLVWTDALLAGYRPSGKPFMTGMLVLEALGTKTRYHATALHMDEVTRQKHMEMGFLDGWGKALDQLVAHAKTL